jgi:hypothetical protein
MGVLDHRRTWRYAVAASPNQCVYAFTRAFSGSGGVFAKAKWDIKRTPKGAVAVYKGRKGIGALGGVLSKTAAFEEDTAVGSRVTFEAEESQPGRTVCAMWLSKSGRAGIAGLVGFTSDARFIRPYMRAVQTEMLALDPASAVGKGLFGTELAAAAPSAAEEATRSAAWAAAVDAVGTDPDATWTCPACGYAKNRGGRVRCTQCRREIGRP